MMNNSFITDYFLPNKESSTHIDYTDNVEKRIKSKKYSEFINAYCSKLQNDDLGGILLGEKVPEDPIIIISFEYNYAMSQTEDRTLFIDSYINELALNTQIVVSKLVLSDSKFKKGDTKCIVAYSDPYEVENNMAFNLNVYFPKINMSVSDQKKVLRPLLLNKYRAENVLFKLDIKPSGDMSNMMLVDSLNSYYPLFGSSKNIGGNCKYVYYFNENNKKVSSDEISNNFDPKNNMDVGKYEMELSTDTNWTYYLPLVLSVKYKGKRYESTVEEEENITINNYIKETLEEETSRIMLNYLDINKRFSMKIYRDRIGKAIYNVFNGDQRGFDLWVQYCKKDESVIYNEEEYKSLYNNFSNKNYITETTLQAYAKEDSPRDYQAWYNNRLNILLDEAVDDPKPGKLSRVLYHIYKLEYVYISNGRKGIWYKHNGAYLNKTNMEDPGIDKLREIIINREKVEKIYSEGSTNKAENKYKKIISFTETTQCLTGVSRFIKHYFAIKSANISLNEDQNIFCVKNCVLESTKTEKGMIARPGILEDYSTYHSNILYRSDLTENHPVVIKERNYSKMIYGSDEKMQYMDMRLSRRLTGASGEKTITLEIGKPNSGKTTNAKVFKMLFGDYLFSGNTTMLTGARGASNNATPDTAHTDKKRDVRFDDPESGSSIKLNEGWLCQESGGSNRHTRFLNDDGIDNSATAEYSISANDLVLRPTEQLIIRTVVFVYNSRILGPDDEHKLNMKVPDTIEEQKRLNIYHKTNFNEVDFIDFATARLWRAVKQQKDINWNYNIPVPDIILNETTKWWNVNDPYHKFKKLHIRKSYNKEFKVPKTLLYNSFVNWYKVQYGNNIPNVQEFSICMRSLIGSSDDEDDCYYGIKLYDKLFMEFVDNTYTIDDNDVILDAYTAYQDYKRWTEVMGVRFLAKDNYTFRSYMSSCAVPYDESVRGFRGLSKIPPKSINELFAKV